MTKNKMQKDFICVKKKSPRQVGEDYKSSNKINYR